jgi:hypothetical protein
VTIVDKGTAAGPASTAQTIALLAEISILDTLYRDLYFQRAHKLMEPVLSNPAYARMKESLASIGSVEQQLRAAVERGDWSKSHELTERIRAIKGSAAAVGEWRKYGKILYDGAADISIDPFAPDFHFHVFASGSTQRLQQRHKRAIEILSTLKRLDGSRKDFYARRESYFAALSIAASDGRPEEKATVSPAQLQREALEALDAGNLSRLDQVVLKLMEKPVAQEAKQESAGAGLAETAELGDDLLYSFSEATLAGAGRLGLAPVQTKSRRHLAYLLPHGWQPSFLP